MGWAHLGRTRESDLAVFCALPVWRAAPVFLGYLLAVLLPVFLSVLVSEYAMSGFTLPLFLYSLALSRTKAGRGAMWFFGKGIVSWSAARRSSDSDGCHLYGVSLFSNRCLRVRQLA